MHERCTTPLAVDVNRAREETLAGARLAVEQHGRVGLREVVANLRRVDVHERRGGFGVHRLLDVQRCRDGERGAPPVRMGHLLVAHDQHEVVLAGADRRAGAG